MVTANPNKIFPRRLAKLALVVFPDNAAARPLIEGRRAPGIEFVTAKSITSISALSKKMTKTARFGDSAAAGRVNCEQDRTPRRHSR